MVKFHTDTARFYCLCHILLYLPEAELVAPRRKRHNHHTAKVQYCKIRNESINLSQETYFLEKFLVKFCISIDNNPQTEKRFSDYKLADNVWYLEVNLE